MTSLAAIPPIDGSFIALNEEPMELPPVEETLEQRVMAMLREIRALLIETVMGDAEDAA